MKSPMLPSDASIDRSGQLPEDSNKTSRSRISAFLLLCAISGVAIFSSTIAKNPVLPILAQQIGADKASIGLIAAASTITGILTSFSAGYLSDRLGRKPLLILSGIVFLTAPFLYLFIQTPLQLAMVRVYHGLATAVFGPVAMAYVTDLASTRRGERLGWFSSSQLAGRALAPVAGAAILAFGAWQWVYAVCAIAGALALLGIFWLPRSAATRTTLPPPPAHQEPRLSTTRIPVRKILFHRTILVTSVAEASQFFAFGALEAFLPLYALSAGVGTATIGLLFGVQVGVRVLVRPLMGRFSDTHGRKRQILIGLLMTALTMIFFPTTSNLVLLLLLSLGFGFGLSVASAATCAFVADLAPQDGRGTALGLMSTIMDIGQALGPILLGVLLMSVSYQVGFAVIGGVMIIATGLFGWLAVEKDNRRRRQGNEHRIP
ncbi:MAG: MFS transporter [Coprothermobacterota bacterium]|nr:MFS transporter [Coprothermobacterota bacterium]